MKLCTINKYEGNVKHKKRDNKFGITWCIRCGRLFTKSCGIKLENEYINKDN